MPGPMFSMCQCGFYRLVCIFYMYRYERFDQRKNNYSLTDAFGNHNLSSASDRISNQQSANKGVIIFEPLTKYLIVHKLLISHLNFNSFDFYGFFSTCVKLDFHFYLLKVSSTAIPMI